MAAEGVKTVSSPSDAPLSETSTDRLSLQLPVRWLNHLLNAHCQVRTDMRFEDAAAHLLGAASELLADAALGVCVPRGALPRTAGETGQIIIRLAPTPASRPVDSDPTRLFPELGFERAIPFIPEHGATLHLAADDAEVLLDGTAAWLLVERLVPLLTSLVENQHALERGLRDLRAQVIQSEKLASLGQIAAGIVHELNNPLTTIVAYSDFLRRKLSSRGDSDDDVERLSRINEAAARIQRFSRDLIAYSRPASEVPAPVLIHDVIERALVFCEHELDKTGVIISRSFGEVRPVRGVAGQLTQVFVNLFTNAAHAMREEGGRLSVATAMSDGAEGEIVVTITDDGHGISEEHRERIFEPFFTTKTDGSGTGLGLSIVRSIVQSHGGRISVDRRDPRGTVFYVGLPSAAAPRDD